MGRVVDIWEERVTMQTSSLNAAAPDSASRSIRVIASALLIALLAHGSAALGQAYPSKPVRILSGQPPGGATDFFARMVAQKLNESWKQSVFIEHRPGASGSIAAELFMSLTDTRMTHIPFKGAGPSILAVVTGNIDLSFGSLPATMGQAKAGRVRALGVSTAQRARAWPDLPTLAESGVPGYEMTSWYAFFGPSTLPKDLVTRLHADIGRIAAQPDFQERLLREGAEHEAMTLERFAQFIRAESARWAKVIRERNVRAQ
jgi:tripartite-type tricarboxylate transporter receptor subunit TctC